MMLNIRNNRKCVMLWGAQPTQETTKNKTAIMGREERVGVWRGGKRGRKHVQPGVLGEP
jgi:hypothetical protein